MKRVPIFKPGRHTAANGATLDFSEDQLRAAIAAYDPKVHQAPLVIGHPKDNGPAFGWVGSLQFNESTGELDALPTEVNADFAEGVKSGAFKMRSASWYLPGSASHPLKGTEQHDTLYLRHVGFLGAMPPAIKGLSAVQFAEDEEGVVEFAEDSYSWGLVARMFRGLRDWLLADKGQEDADRVLPSYFVEDLERQANRARDAENGSAVPFAEPRNPTGDTTMTPEEIQAMQARNAELEAANAAQATQLAQFQENERKAQRAAAVAGFKAELAPLVTAGKVLPREVDGMAEFMATLDNATEVLEFGEEPAEGQERKGRTALAHFRAQLQARPTAVDFNEHSAGNPNDQQGLSAAEAAKRAQAYHAAQTTAGNHISFTEAMDAVLAGRDQPQT